jgi:hypothetical protein
MIAMHPDDYQVEFSWIIGLPFFLDRKIPRDKVIITRQPWNWQNDPH